jgi:UDP-3-O-[3-hydroxymyristoyl] glucosamine N-acyltransferase
MADPRFFKVAGPFSLEQLAEISGSEIGSNGEKSTEFYDILPLESATQTDVSFIDNRRYVDAFSVSKAGAILTPPELADQAPKGAVLLITESPYTGYAKLTQAFYPIVMELDAVIDERAVIESSAKIGKNVTIEAGVVVKENSEIGDGTVIAANTYVGAGVVIGRNCRIGPSVTLSHCKLGDDNIIHTGVRIGQDGFGFAPGMPSHTKVLQLGRVIVGNDIEIGANSTVDRGAGPDTVIGDGTKIDNLVQIGHNVKIGQGCFLVAHSGISGSSVIGNYVMLGGQAGVVGHISIGDGAKITAQSGVTTSVPAGETVAGSPAQNAREYWKYLAVLRRLVKEKRGK